MKRFQILCFILIVTAGLWLAAGCSSPTPQAPAPTQASQPTKTTSSATSASSVSATASTAGQPTKGGSITVSMGVNCADTLNEHISINTGCRMIGHHVLDTLVVVNPRDGSINPSLATSWERSTDGLSYTFKLRKDIKFQDGTPFNAQAVKYNLDYTMRPDVKHGFAYGAMGGTRYDKTEVVDDYTVKVSFKSPHPTFLINLSDGGLGIDSPTAMDKYGNDYGIKALVGTGPFKFKEWVNGDHITLVRSDEYIVSPTIYKHTGLPYLDQITWRDVADVATRAAALEAGELQVATLVEATTAPFKNSKDVTLLTTPKAGTARMFMMNNAKAPTDDVKVRQAVNYAIDRAGLIQLPAWSGFGKPGLAPLPANMLPPDVAEKLKPYGYSYDPAKASQLLEEAGWKMGSDGVREKGGQKLILDALAIAPTEPTNFEPVDQMLRKVGMKLNIRTGDFNWQTATRSKGDFNIALSSDSGYDSLRLINYFFHSQSPSNVYGFKGADPYIDKAQNALTDKEVWDNLTLAMIEILKNAVGAMGWEQVYIYGSSVKVHNVFFNEVGYPFYYDASVESK